MHYRYDNNGNMRSEQKYTYGEGEISSTMSVLGGSGPKLNIYNHDAFNQLAAYYDSGEVTSYTYNAGGLRVSKTVNGSRTTFTWNGQNWAYEVNGD